MPFPPVIVPVDTNSDPFPRQVGCCTQTTEDSLIAGVIVSVLLEVALAQGGFPVAVNVMITLPAALSAELGVYVAVVREV